MECPGLDLVESIGMHDVNPMRDAPAERLKIGIDSVHREVLRDLFVMELRDFSRLPKPVVVVSDEALRFELREQFEKVSVALHLPLDHCPDVLVPPPMLRLSPEVMKVAKLDLAQLPVLLL